MYTFDLDDGEIAIDFMPASNYPGANESVLDQGADSFNVSLTETVS